MRKLVLLLLTALPIFSFALTRISVQNGSWNNPNIWSPAGVPQQTDDSVIVATAVSLGGQNLIVGNTYFEIAVTGSLTGMTIDTLTFGGGTFEINNYLGLGVLIVGATDSVVNNNQIEVNEVMQSGTMINHMWICVATQLTTSDVFVNNGSVSSGNWINSGVVSGTQGQFCVAQNFINSDQISGSLDICDASPGGMGDLNMGTISGSVTNCAVGACAQCLQPGFDEHVIYAGLSIAPHPVHCISTITLETESLQMNSVSQFVLTDLQGRIVASYPIMGKQFEFSRNNLDSGLYLYSISHEGAVLSAGKLLID